MHPTPAILGTTLVTILAIVVYIVTTVRVGAMRIKFDVKAPAVSGHPMFERAFRVQMNTLERLPIFLPLLWLAAAFFAPQPAVAPLLGLVWVVGRVLYMTGYMRDPDKRGLGFGISALAEILLLLTALWGVVTAMIV